MKQFIFICLLIFNSFSSFCQTEPDLIIKEFFDTYSKKLPDKAMDDLYSHSSWIDSKSDAVVNLKTQFRDLINLVGDYYGNQLLVKKTMADSFVIYVYIVKFDRQPFKFVFEFYKPKDKWNIYSFSYDDSIDDDLEAAAKTEIVK